MLKKRIIPCLDIKAGRVVKGVQFEQLKDNGDPVELAYQYMQQGADELVFLDITATRDNRKTLLEWVKKVAQVIQIPFTVGGGITTLQDASAIIDCGADKISINSSAVKTPELITQIAQQFGSQCVVVAVDTKYVNGKNKVFISGGKTETDTLTEEWCTTVQELGAGEILLTSIDHDGTQAGFALDLLKKITENVTIPVIASGGAGKKEHFAELFMQTRVSAALAASVFHNQTILIPQLKQFLSQHSIPVRYAKH